MKKEQIEMVQAFRGTYNTQMKEPIVIYGTGINAEAIITSCKDCSIVGVVDVAKTGELFCGFQVMSLDEIAKRNVKKIVVVARPSVHSIIYKRIQKWCKENGVFVLDIYGNNIAKKVKVRTHDLPYFKISFDRLKEEIEGHDIISFDVFDTLLMRRVYTPTDVFVLVDREIMGRFPFVFSEERKEAECELRKKYEPTIYQIYEYLAKKHCLSEEEKLNLLSLEIKKEKEVLCVREKMKLCMESCIHQGKKVYLLSDMYLPSELLKGLLEQCGITGYTELLVSCDYHTSKPENLFKILKEKAKGKRYLHIGDNEEADYISPQRHGIDAFLIMSAVRIMECSAYSDALIHLKSTSSRIMLGMLAAEVFQDPFVLNKTRGIPIIYNAEQFGYVFIGPLVLSFTVWLLCKISTKKNSLLLFSARDGWLIRKVYHLLADAWNLRTLPDDVYFMVSRKALELVQKNENMEGVNYQEYLKSLKLSEYREIFYFDFMSRGTCQSVLENISGIRMQGIYFQKSISGIASKDVIKVWAYFKESSAYDKDLSVFALCDFLECIFTSYYPSFFKIGEEGKYIYEEEKRNKEQLDALKKIHSGIIRYCSDFSKSMTSMPKDMPSNEYCDEILRYMTSEYSQIMIPELREFVLDDWLGGDKSPGKDALM